MQNELLDKYKDRVKFSSEKPPVFDQCKAKFGITWNGTIFAYAPSIHCADPNTLTKDVIEHELVHIERQGNDPVLWWEQYMANPEFRLNEEMLAYQRQYRHLKGRGIDKNELDNKVRFWCSNLAGMGYGYLIDFNEAYKQITK